MSNSNILVKLLDYIHLGGRQSSILCLFGFILFHPAFDSISIVENFVHNGGKITQNLLNLSNEISDLICLFDSFCVSNEFNPSIFNSSDPNILRLALLKCLTAPALCCTAEQILYAYSKTKSCLAIVFIFEVFSI